MRFLACQASRCGTMEKVPKFLSSYLNGILKRHLLLSNLSLNCNFVLVGQWGKRRDLELVLYEGHVCAENSWCLRQVKPSSNQWFPPKLFNTVMPVLYFYYLHILRAIEGCQEALTIKMVFFNEKKILMPRGQIHLAQLNQNVWDTSFLQLQKC